MSIMQRETGIRQQITLYLFKKQIHKQTICGQILKKENIKILTMVYLIFFFIHGIDMCSRPILQKCLQQKPSQVYCQDIVRQNFSYTKNMGNIIISIWSTAENSPRVWAVLFPEQTIYGHRNLLVTIWEPHVTIFQEKLILESLLLHHSRALTFSTLGYKLLFPFCFLKV